MRDVRWREGVCCPRCGSHSVVKHGRHLKVYQRYLCKGCGQHFNDRTGTQFDDSKLPLRVWFFIAFLMQYQVSVKEIAKTAKISYLTAFNRTKMLRRSLHRSQLREKMKGIVELDEVYVTAGLKGKQDLKRSPRVRGLKVRGRGTYKTDKPPIMGMVERGGAVRIIPASDVRGRTALRRVMKHIDDEAEAIYTDEYPAYHILDGFCNHQTVNHSQGEYARGGGIHINTVEAEFSVFRPWMSTYRGISKEKLYLYRAQYNFLRNTREEDRARRAAAIAISHPTNIEQYSCTISFI
ncbi:IS1595 family transposase [Candidatus Bathyarchaeota archaeon]|nr:IS1595 family transposase [Candidatus Bathyarchaeota archaeon]